MHQYPTTEPQFESGEQGGYVLYRVFKKQEERSAHTNPEEIERSGYSSTPSRSSADTTDANEEANTLLNSLEENPINLPHSVEIHHAGIRRWLTGGTDNSAADVCSTADPNFSWRD